MNRPTPEQVAEARGKVERLIKWVDAYPEDFAALRVLLAATEPPTDEEIAERAADKANEACGYLAGPCDVSEAIISIDGGGVTPWSKTVRAIHGAVRHFFGPVKP